MVLQGGKKGRKRSKKKTDLDKDLEEAEAGPDARELALLQSQMLEVRMLSCMSKNSMSAFHRQNLAKAIAQSACVGCPL